MKETNHWERSGQVGQTKAMMNEKNKQVQGFMFELLNMGSVMSLYFAGGNLPVSEGDSVKASGHIKVKMEAGNSGRVYPKIQLKVDKLEKIA